MKKIRVEGEPSEKQEHSVLEFWGVMSDNVSAPSFTLRCNVMRFRGHPLSFLLFLHVTAENMIVGLSCCRLFYLDASLKLENA
jgi:hypothetical protein